MKRVLALSSTGLVAAGSTVQLRNGQMNSAIQQRSPSASSANYVSDQSSARPFQTHVPFATSRRYCSTSNQGEINPDDICIESEAEESYGSTPNHHNPAASHLNAETTELATESIGWSSMHEFVDVIELDNFAKAKVINFIKRATSAEDRDRNSNPKSGGGLSDLAEVKEVRVQDGSTYFHARIAVPLPQPYGTKFGEGFSCDAKDAELLAAMHCEYIIDKLGFQIYTLPSMQKKHASAARKAGRWAPSPEDARNDPSTTTLPQPLRRVIHHDESEGGKWSLLTVEEHLLQSNPYALFSPAVFDPNATNRIRQLFHNIGSSFDQFLKIKEVPSTVHKEGNQVEAEILLPVPDEYGSVVAKGKAADRITAVALMCMHAELLLDEIGVCLYSSSEAQTSHAHAARAFGRRAPLTKEELTPLNALSLPLPLKQYTPIPGRTRHAPLSTEENMLRMARLVSNETTAHTDVEILNEEDRAALQYFLEVNRSPRCGNPYFVERVAGTYRATVCLPLPELYGARGGVGIGRSAQEAETLAAMHAVDILNNLGIPPYEGNEEALSTHEKKRREKGFVVASDVKDGASRAVEDSSPGAFRYIGWRTIAAKAQAEEQQAKDAERKLKREQVLKSMSKGSGTTAPSQGNQQQSSSSFSEKTREELIAEEEANKFDYLKKRESVPKTAWSLDSDTPDGFILVQPSDGSTTFGHTLVSPRQYDGMALRRFKGYLGSVGKKYAELMTVEKFTTEFDGLQWHRVIFQLPCPKKFGQRIALGEGPTPLEAENLAASHAELILDTLGIPLYNEEYGQRRHAHSARLQGRYAPLPGDPMMPFETPSPPPLRKERVDSYNWSKTMKQQPQQQRGTGNQQRSNATSGGAASNSDRRALNTLEDVDDWKTAEYEIVPDGKLDTNSKARVQNYQRRVKCNAEAVLVQHMLNKTQFHVARLKLEVPKKFGVRYAMGVAASKKDAEQLCFMHAERTIDALGIQLFNLPGLQKRHVDRVKKEGRWATGFGEQANKPADTPSPLPLKARGAPGGGKSGSGATGIGIGASHFAQRIPQPPVSQEDINDVKRWNEYITKCQSYIDAAKEAAEMECIVAEKVPRTGNPFYDSTLEEAEQQEVDPRIKSELYEYCARTNQSYPTYWKIKIVGPSHARKTLTTVEVPGFEHIHATGIGSNKETSHRRAAMHVFALLRRLDPDFLAQEKMMKEQGSGESLQSSKSTVKFKGSYDRMSKSFTQEGKVRLVDMYTVMCGLNPPKIVHTQRKEGNFIVQSTAVEIVDERGLKYIGRSSEGGNKVNEPAAYEELFNKLWKNVPKFCMLMDLVKTHPHLDPEHIVDLSIPPAVQDKIDAVLATSIGESALQEEITEVDNSVDMTTQKLVEATNQTTVADERRMQQQSQILKSRMESKLADPVYLEKFAARRNTLSIAAHKEQILSTIRDNPITVLCGTTGCGKTTQVPQYILDDATEKGEGGKCSVIVTQPRRISAVSISQRIADERREDLGDAVGYTIRLDSKPGQHINFCTSGVLLRIFQAKPNLEGITHVIIDEIHERDINSDFLLILLKDLVIRCPHIRVILMSATLQSAQFSSYFGGAPVVNVEGHVYPVKELFLEDVAKLAGDLKAPLTPSMKDVPQYDKDAEEFCQTNSCSLYEVREEIDYGAITFAVEHVRKSMDLNNSSILVFLPGWDEIQKAKDNINLVAPLVYHTITLHSSVTSEEQLECFKPAPQGKVKLILSTNIAESGVTIDDIAAVIDIGRAKEKSFVLKKGRTNVTRNELGALSQLVTVFASRANCTQRRGRAGRTREGIVIRLYTKKHLTLVADFQTPEMLRQPLDALCLQILALGLGNPSEFLAKALEPPSPEHINGAMERLYNLGAVSGHGKLTPLGLRLSKLPVTPRVGKMIVLGAMLRCLDSVLTMAATTDMDVFLSARDQKDIVRIQREEASLNTQSDQLTSLNAYNMWASANAEKTQNDVLMLLQNYVLNPQTLMVVSQYKKQFYDILVASDFLPGAKYAPKAPVYVDDSEFSTHSSDIGLVKSVLSASLFPNAAINRGKRLMRNKFDNVIAPSPGSIIHRTSQEDIHNPFFVFEEMTKSPDGKMFLRGLTSVSLWSILLLGASNSHLTFENELSLGMIDDWILFRANSEVLDTIRGLKQRIDECITRKLVEPENTLVTESLDQIQDIIRELVNSPMRPNGLVEEAWEDNGVISAAIPLPESKYGNHFIHHLPQTTPVSVGRGAASASISSSPLEDAEQDLKEMAMERAQAADMLENDDEDIVVDHHVEVDDDLDLDGLK